MMRNRISPMAYQSPRSRQAGLTLLELLISMTLGLVLVTGIGTIYVGSNQAYRVQEQNARIQESGRFALDILGRSIRQAGYWTVPISPTDLKNCLGYNPANFPATCDATPITGTASSATVQYESAGASDCSGNSPATSTEVITEAFDLNGGNLRCTASTVTSPLVSNVEDLQFLYGLDTDGDLSADRYVTAPTGAGQPAQVVSVRACILIRSGDQGVATAPQRYLNCAGALGTAATAAAAFTTALASDNLRLHRVFVGTFNLRNRVP